MGQLINGVWHDIWYDTKSTGGRFKHTEAVWRNCVTADGSAGFTTERVCLTGLPVGAPYIVDAQAEGTRDEMISFSVVHPLMLENGWTFNDDFPAETGDSLYQNEFLISALFACRSAVQRTRNRAGAVG